MLWVIREIFFWPYQALLGLTRPDRLKASPQSMGRCVVDWLIELISLFDESLREEFAERGQPVHTMTL